MTGASSALGRAMAAALTTAGARVALTSRDAGRAAAVAAKLGPRAFGLPLDVRSGRSVREGVDQVYERFGGLDLLVVNAGTGMRTVNPRFMTDPEPFWKVSPEGFRDLVETKMTGSFLTAREVAPRMLDEGGGQIVIISMSRQTMTRRGFVPYGPSGAAVEALARVIAADLEDTPVSVNILLPGGATATGMLPDEVPQELHQRLLNPAVMGPPIVWLASAAAAGVHDQRIVANEFDDWLARR